jgi:hypothetical protein
MSQISRPFQIALLAVAVLAAAWLFVFQPHASNTASSESSSAVVSSPTPSASASAAAEAKSAGSPSSIYHGSAPGVEGLTRAVAHAHGAVAKSQQNAARLRKASEQASGQTASTPASATPAHTVSSSATKAAQPTKTATTPVSKVHHTTTTPSTAHKVSGVPTGQRAVEAQLAHGKVAVVLLWNPAGVEDAVVRSELKLLARGDHRIAINVAPAGQAASFGTITRGVQVYGTPTMLIIDKQGKTIVLSGLQDTFSIRQAIQEARQA